MKTVIVLPAIRLAPQDSPLLKAAITYIKDLRPTAVYLTGLVSGEVCECSKTCLRGGCLPSDRLLRRFEDVFLYPLKDIHHGDIGFVGMQTVDMVRCGYRTIETQDLLSRTGVRALPRRHEIAPGWCVLGRPRQLCERPGIAPGTTAVRVSKAIGCSVIVGDTGRLGIGRVRLVGGAGVRTLTGVDAGSLVHGAAKNQKRDRRRTSEAGVATVTVDRRGRVVAKCVPL